LSGGGGGKGGPLLRKWLLGSTGNTALGGTKWRGAPNILPGRGGGKGSPLLRKWLLGSLGTLDFRKEEHNQGPVLGHQVEKALWHMLHVKYQMHKDLLIFQILSSF
jgi:hypothetical protein